MTTQQAALTILVRPGLKYWFGDIQISQAPGSVIPAAFIWDQARLAIPGGAAFSDDGSKVVIGSLAEAKVWRLDTLDLPITLNVPAGRVMTVAFTQDGSEAATATDDGRLWISHVDWRWLVDQIPSGTRACLSTDQRIRLLGETPPSAERGSSPSITAR